MRAQGPYLRPFSRGTGCPSRSTVTTGNRLPVRSALSRLTRLAVWFMDLGIQPVYSDPAHPEHNGSHERMHEELKAEATENSL